MHEGFITQCESHEIENGERVRFSDVFAMETAFALNWSAPAHGFGFANPI